MRPKDALTKDGFPGIKPGKGRLSLAAIERCKVLAAVGNEQHPGPWQIDGYSLPSPAVSAETAGAVAAQVTKVKPANGAKVISDIPDERRSEDSWSAHVPGGKRIGMREVCAKCSNSFTYCFCETSFFNLDYKTVVPVDFKPIREKG